MNAVFSAVFASIVGFGMIGQWSVPFLFKRVPELKTEPIRIWFHIAAEMITALLLVLSGIMQLTGAVAGQTFFLVAAGILFYTCIIRSGYFPQQGNWIWLVIFSTLITLGFIGIVLLV